MPRLECFSVHIIDVVRMEDAGTGAVQNGLFAGRVGKTETSPAMKVVVSILTKDSSGVIRYLPRLLCGRAHNGNAFWHHDLISDMSV